MKEIQAHIYPFRYYPNKAVIMYAKPVNADTIDNLYHIHADFMLL